MLTELTKKNISLLKNESLRSYASIYQKIADQFYQNVAKIGLQFDDQPNEQMNVALHERLKKKQAIYRNNDFSVYTERISPACLECRTGVNSATSYVSLACHRSCYFCFNPNQETYEMHSNRKKDYIQEIDQWLKKNPNLEHIALTGGEPLLHKKDVVAFFDYVKQKAPQIYTRLYTSGDLLDTAILQALQEANLNEIRFSIKLDDTEEEIEKVLEIIELTKAYIPIVMVEMPVIPNHLSKMKQLLKKLNDLRIFGINLLEFCYPLNNVNEFKKRGHKIKNRPFRVLYNYWYAGGLPISSSEEDALLLVEYALDEKMNLGVHYCSLENKHTGQVYQQNVNQKVDPSYTLSDRDFFLKTAKVFGKKEIAITEKLLKQHGYNDPIINTDHLFIQFPLTYIPLLEGKIDEICLSYNIVENRNNEVVVRELKLDLVNPSSFSIEKI